MSELEKVACPLWDKHFVCGSLPLSIVNHKDIIKNVSILCWAFRVDVQNRPEITNIDIPMNTNRFVSLALSSSESQKTNKCCWCLFNHCCMDQDFDSLRSITIYWQGVSLRVENPLLQVNFLLIGK